MKKHLQLIFSFILLIVALVFVPSVKAYEAEQLVDCISSANKNSALDGVPKSSIESYCDCALELIVDKGKDVRESGYECAVSNFA
tara:strand:+ start:167 stop:421 length:255 start_codon:yes stop_codon:yes gene_type:complete